MGKFDRYAFSAQPSFDEAATRKAFSKAVPLKTLVIYCYDPRVLSGTAWENAFRVAASSNEG